MIISMHQKMPRFNSDQQGRINLKDLKMQISKQLGPDRTRMYFGFLTRFLARKLTKTEFDKFCLLVLGRQNIPLHNKLIRSILKNAYEAKTPPPVGEEIALNQTGASAKKSLHGNESLSPLKPKTPASLIQCNGHILPPSPRKNSTRKCHLGLNGRADGAQPVDISIEENGVLGPDLKRPRQHYQSGFREKPPKYPRKAVSLLRDHICLHRKRQLEGAPKEENEKLKESNDLNSTKRPFGAPIGVSYRPSSVGGKRKSLPSPRSSISVASIRDNGELYHTEDLKKSMERVAEAQGIGVTLGCANLLNNALNTYLKRIIKSAVELARVRSMHEPTKQPVVKQQVNDRPLNAIWAGNHMHVQKCVESMNVNNSHWNQYMISLRDFQVAMELNPQQLGDNWPLLLEKISFRSFEE